MPCFYIRNASFIALFKVDEEMNGVVSAELIPNENLSSYIKNRGLISYTIRKIFEDEQVTADDFQGRSKNNNDLILNQEDENVDIQELLRNVDQNKIRIQTQEQLK